MLHLYQSIKFYAISGREVFKYQGQVSEEKERFWIDHFAAGGHTVLIFNDYKGDRVNRDGTPFIEGSWVGALTATR